MCVSDKSGERHCLRPKPHAYFRADESDDRAPPKLVRVIAGVHVDVPLSRGLLKKSTAAAVDTLIAHSAICPAVCRTMRSDYNALRDAPPAINRAVPRAWLENLYCRPSDGLDDSAVKRELIARQKVGKVANMTRGLLRRAAASVEFRRDKFDMAFRPSGDGGGKGITIFQCPATWSEIQKQAATELLGTHQLDAFPCTNDDLVASKGLAMTHSRVLTLDEANGNAPCDREQLMELIDFSLNGVAKRLQGRTLTCLVTNVALVNLNAAQNPADRGGAPGPVDYDAAAAELRGILDHLPDHRLSTAWTNKVPHPYDPVEQRKARFSCEEFRAECHDSLRPTIQSYTELFRLMVEKNVFVASLDADGTQQTSGNKSLRRKDHDLGTMFVPQGATRVDVTVATNALAWAQAYDREDKKQPFPSFLFIDISSIKGTAASTAIQENISLKVDANVFHEIVNFEHGHAFLKIGNGRFRINMHLRVPGMD